MNMSYLKNIKLQKILILIVLVCWSGIFLITFRRGIYKEAPEVVKAPIQSIHDFGAVITNGKPLRHVFRFMNNSSQEIRILGSERSSSCCTSFGTMSKEVGAGGVIEIPVELKTMGKAGNLNGRFVIRTDSPIAPAIGMELRANLFESFEVREIYSAFQVILGRKSSKHFEVITRSPRGESVIWPVVSGMSARLEDKILQPNEVVENVVESTKDLVITPDSMGELGRRSDVVRFLWPDGHEKIYTFAWEIIPPIRAIPQTLVLDPRVGEVSRTILISSDETPFQILGVNGAGVRSYRVHSGEKGVIRLELRLDPAILGEVSKIRIATDHPTVAEVDLNIIVPKPRH